MNSNLRGFTLIEVLIASLIMFISLGVFTSVYRGALISSEKAELNISRSNSVYLILERISSDLKVNHMKNEMEGEGNVLKVNYQWKAKVSQMSKPPARYFGSERSQVDHVMKLWNIELVVIKNGSRKSYNYVEKSW